MKFPQFLTGYVRVVPDWHFTQAGRYIGIKLLMYGPDVRRTDARSLKYDPF